MVKLLDYWNRWPELEQSKNPFALVVRIHLKGLETQKRPDQRLHWKVEFCKALYRAKYTKQQIRDLFWFMDWVLALPEDLEPQFEKFYQEYKEFPILLESKSSDLDTGLPKSYDLDSNSA